MPVFESIRRLWRALGWSLQLTDEGRRTKRIRSSRNWRSRPVSEQLEQRVLLTTMTLSGTSGNDTIIFQQTDATHDTFTLNGTPTTFSTVGVTAITIDAMSGTDSISILSDNAGIPLTIMGSGADTVNVGNAGDAHGIMGTLILSGATGQMSLTVDDSADPRDTVADVSTTAVTGLTPGDIQFSSGQLASITLDGGTGANTFDVSGTAAGTPLTLNDGHGADRLVGPDQTQTWNLNGHFSGSVGNITFSSIGNLVGGSGDDTFDLGPNGVYASIDGGGGNNTLVGSNVRMTNIWTISSGNSGALNEFTSNEVDFQNIQNLTGGTKYDFFEFQPSGFVSGTVNGGGGDATLDYSSRTSDVIVNLQANSATAIGGGFSNIENLIGSTGSNNTLTAANTQNFWAITGVNEGTLTMGVATPFNFAGIENLNGGTANDIFAFYSGYVSGTVNGGGGFQDELSYPGNTSGIAINLQTNSATDIGGGFSNINTVLGTEGDDTITGANTANTWDITGTDAGIINGAFSFAHIANLIGGTANDTFAFQTFGSVSGTIQGGGGTNTLDYSALSNIPVLVNLNNGAATNAGEVSNIQSVIGSASGANTLIGANVTNTWDITGGNSGTLNGFAFANIQNLTGGTADDTFAFQPSGFASGIVNGGGGTDTLDYSNRSTDVVVNLQTNSATAIGGGFSNITGLIGSSSSDNMLTGVNLGDFWDIMGANSGTVESRFNGTYSFSGFENLTGGRGTEIFTIENGGSLSGAINGGGGIQDSLDDSRYTLPNSVNLQTNSATAIAGGFSNINTLFGNEVSTTLVGANTTNFWNLTGTDDGTVNGTFSFAHVQNLTGGTANDTFAFQTFGSIGGTIQGGGGNNTLVGPNVSNTWDVTGTNAGTLNGATFLNIQNLTGGTGIDTFLLSNNAGITGMLNGDNATGDWLDYSAYSSPVTVNLATGAATNIGGGVTNIQNVRGGSGKNKLVGDSLGNILIGGGAADTIVGGSGRSILIGGAGADKVKGGSADDIIIGGTTSYDSSSLVHNAALASILAEWQSSNSYATRIAHIKGTLLGGLNGTNDLIFGSTVKGDGAANILTGGGGMNWFFKGAHDTITDYHHGEQIN